jgi:hypothetical protein
MGKRKSDYEKLVRMRVDVNEDEHILWWTCCFSILYWIQLFLHVQWMFNKFA